MHFEFNIFSIILLGSGLVISITSYLIFKTKGSVVRSFGFVMVAIVLWAITYGLELASPTLEQMLFWINLEYIGISLLPGLWIVFVIKFIGREGWLTVFNIALIFLIPFFTMLLVWTNTYHHLHYAHVDVSASGPFPLLVIVPGLWYKFFTFYFYTMMAWGIYLLVNKFRKADIIYRRQNRMIVIGAVFPWLVNLIYLLDYRPLNHIDLTPYAFIITVLSISFGILRFKLFDVVPVAREKVLEVMSDGMMVLDNQNRIVDVNSEMKKYFRGDSGELIGVHYGDFFPGQDVLHFMVNERMQDKIEIRTGEPPRYFEVNLTPLFEKDTVYSGIILLFREITEKKLAEEKLKDQSDELQALNRLKDKLFTIISHDLRGPFKSLLDILRMSEKGHISAEEVKALLPHAIKYTDNITGLLENLLHWSKSQLQGEIINRESFDLKEVVAEQVELIDKRAREKLIHLTDQVTPDTRVFADRNMVQLIVRNLLANAVKFCNAEDTVTIMAYQSGKHTTVEVVDSGVGISREVQEKLFGMEGYTSFGTKKEKGTGLGLLLCKDFVEKNDGKIWLESEAGQGSTFYFTLPNG